LNPDQVLSENYDRSRKLQPAHTRPAGREPEEHPHAVAGIRGALHERGGGPVLADRPEAGA
jgi:hypothetical protein